MAFQSSMQFTVGSTLSRAETMGLAVDVLVEGQWLDGIVIALDALGVVLDNGGPEPWTVRLDRVSVVRVRPRDEADVTPGQLLSAAPEVA